MSIYLLAQALVLHHFYIFRNSIILKYWWMLTRAGNETNINILNFHLHSPNIFSTIFQNQLVPSAGDCVWVMLRAVLHSSQHNTALFFCKKFVTWVCQNRYKIGFSGFSSTPGQSTPNPSTPGYLFYRIRISLWQFLSCQMQSLLIMERLFKDFKLVLQLINNFLNNMKCNYRSYLCIWIAIKWLINTSELTNTWLL